MANYTSTETYNVTAVAPNGASKVIASKVGAFRAAKLAAEIEARGFTVRVEPTAATARAVIHALTD